MEKGYELSSNIEDDIFALGDQLVDFCGAGVGSQPRCGKCWHLTNQHEHYELGQGCGYPKLNGEEYCEDLKIQRSHLQQLLDYQTSRVESERKLKEEQKEKLEKEAEVAWMKKVKLDSRK